MKIISIVYNVLCYLAFLASVLLLGFGARAHAGMYGISAMFRDIVLAIIFLVFFLSLKIGLREIENYAIIEKWLFRSAWVVALLLLVRGVLPFTQGILILTEDDAQEKECKIGFMVWWILSELLIEGFPLWYIVRKSSNWLVDVQMGVTERQA
jgi:hypothetical protein